MKTLGRELGYIRLISLTKNLVRSSAKEIAEGILDAA
jgi:hypothetical protein